MPHLDLAHAVLAGAISAVLVWAAVSDIVARRIPNAAVLVLLALYGAWVAIGLGAGLVSAVTAAAIGFAVGFGLYVFKIMGAGDVKLFAVTALFAGMAYLPLFAFATAIAGGAIALVSFASRPRRAAVMLTLRGKGDFGRGVPYGVAIAFGGAFVIWGGLCGMASGIRLIP